MNCERCHASSVGEESWRLRLAGWLAGWMDVSICGGEASEGGRGAGTWVLLT